MTRDPGLDELNPILVTGSSLLVDDDLWPHFRELAEEWAGKQGVELELEENRERGFVRVGAAGGKLDTPASVRLATELLERGQSRCIIGTRALLGEGWDCRRLNTLIDLTVVTSGVSVNQLRGRSLRLDQENPGKVANHWDVLCLSAVGDRTDLERIVRRHDQLYGVTDDGQVERGVGHFHASFSHRDPAELYAKRAEVNQAMHDRAATRAETRARWRVGEPCRDEEWSVFGFTAAGAGVRARGATADVARESALLLSPSGLSEARFALVKKALSGLAGSAAMIAITAATSGGVLWGAASIPTLAGLVWALRSRLPNVGERGLAAELQLLAEILVEAEGGGAMTPRISERADGTLRLVWEGTEASRAARFSTAMAELLGPVSAQRYLLRESLREVPPSIFGLLFGNVTHTERVFPVPRMFGRRSAAERLLEVWRTRRHPDAALIHTKEDAERSVLVRFRGVRPIAGRSTLDVIWR